MHFSAATVLAFAAAALAQTQGFDSISKPAAGEAITAGSSFTVAWTAPEKYKDGTVTIELVGGKDATSLVPLSKVASNVKNSDGTYTWKVDSSLGKDKAYGLKFVWDKDSSVYQWSNGFSIKASGDQASGSGSASGTASGTASQASTTDSQSATTTAASATTGSVSGSASASASASASNSGSSSGTNSGTSSGTVSGSSASASSVTGSATQSGATTLVQSLSSSGSAAASTTPARTSSRTTTTSGRSPTATGGAAAVHAGSLTVLGLVAAALAL